MTFPTGGAMEQNSGDRRGFLRRLIGGAGVAAALPVAAAAQENRAARGTAWLPEYARAQNHTTLKQSSFDTTGGNADAWPMAAGGEREVFHADGPGVITHIWFTIAAQSSNHLKEMVLRAYWDGSDKPSVETPIGDFFGLNLGQYAIYQSAYLACSPGKSLNCYFAMPYKKSARLTVTNEGKEKVGALYSNIDYQNVPSLPADASYFHAQYRQAAPCVPVTGPESEKNLDGKNNYIFGEAHGRGHLMGVTLGVLQNADGWWGEGDEMIFVDNESKPVINGTGSEDYFLGSWDFGGRDGAIPFGHRQYGAPLIVDPERTGGRYCCYRWHGDNPVAFRHYLKHTIEHGHGNNRSDNFFSACYWYQSEPYTDFPALPPVAERIPKVKTS
ncbi:MAG TPA: glycoside hydrolase family 172 protein [Bryobacteraceae bacterium]|nr:glycoside hydrolase family 172 protein [Bryobacteraceae bacterium]